MSHKNDAQIEIPLVSDLVDFEYIQQVFNELEKMDVELDDDPLALGPKRLQGKVQLARTMLSRTEAFFIQLSRKLSLLQRQLRAYETAFELQVTHKLANDPTVRAGGNITDRKSIAYSKLQRQRERILNYQSAVREIEAALSLVKSKRTDLKDIQGRIRDQIKLCQEEIGLGDQWGNKRMPSGTGLVPRVGMGGGINDDSVDALINDLERGGLELIMEEDEEETEEEETEDASEDASEPEEDASEPEEDEDTLETEDTSEPEESVPEMDPDEFAEVLEKELAATADITDVESILNSDALETVITDDNSSDDDSDEGIDSLIKAFGGAAP